MGFAPRSGRPAADRILVAARPAVAADRHAKRPARSLASQASRHRSPEPQAPGMSELSEVDKVKTNFEYINGSMARRASDHENMTVQSRHTLAERLASLERAIVGTGYDTEKPAGEPGPPEPEAGHEPAFYPAPAGPRIRRPAVPEPAFPEPAFPERDFPESGDPGDAEYGFPERQFPDRGRVAPSDDERTERIINAGRHTVRRPRVPRAGRLLIAAGGLGVFIAVLATTVFRNGPSWPASVAVVQSEIAAACQNPDVVAEPTQVNLACAKPTEKILWVFSLMTSGDNPDFADPSSGRKGLEPITPAQGGEVAWSLNLHHPYNPYNPVDSLEVAARAINNIVGGATLTGSNGAPSVQPGLESAPANCARYTGSAAIVSRQGYPDVCASPVTSATGLAALVTDVYRQWVVGAAAQTAQDAGVLFADAGDPGNARVQQILRGLTGQ